MATPRSILVIGAGIAGVSAAYFLHRGNPDLKITLVDQGQPMGFTSAQSGENYRNWWPHPAMVALTNHSIDLMEEIAVETGNQIAMTRRGYALATRADDITGLVDQLHDGLQDTAARLLRFHDAVDAPDYSPALSADWRSAPDGVDILRDAALIQTHFPGYDPAIRAVIHIRRGGDISGPQLGAHMLDYLRAGGMARVTGMVRELSADAGVRAEIDSAEGRQTLTADIVVNAAGPFAGHIAQMLGVDLPVFNQLQQKIAFEDHLGAIPRNRPFSIDLDPQVIDWADPDRAALAADPEFAWLADEFPGSIHCRPDGGDGGRWVKLGWAFNRQTAPPDWTPDLSPHFPEIVLRGAARLQPALRRYYGHLPKAMHHYGGWYTMTDENWPLIGPMGSGPGYMVCALSGFGTMAACAAGHLCADWVLDRPRPDYASVLSAQRYENDELMRALRIANKGVL